MVETIMYRNIRGWDCCKLVGVDLEEDRGNLTVTKDLQRLAIKLAYVAPRPRPLDVIWLPTRRVS